MAAPDSFLYDVFFLDLPDLPGRQEKFLFHITGAVDVAARTGELDALTVSEALRTQFESFSLLNPAILKDAPVVTALTPGSIWKVTSDYHEYIIRRELVVDGANPGGTAVLAVYENVQSRGKIVDFMITLRDTPT